MKNKLFLLIASSIMLVTACAPNAPTTQAPDGTSLTPDGRTIGGKVTGTKVNSSTMIAIFGAFGNLSGNKINAQNDTVAQDVVIAVAPVAEGKYNFALPKAPSKANTAASFQLYAFQDANGNKTYDNGEVKSKEAVIRWVVALGYQSGKDADGNEVIFSNFESFNFTLD